MCVVYRVFDDFMNMRDKIRVEIVQESRSELRGVNYYGILHVWVFD